MRPIRSLSATAAAIAIAAGAAVSPVALASPEAPEQVQGDAQLSTITEHNIEDAVRAFDGAVTEHEYTDEATGKTHTTNVVNFAAIPDRYKWLGYVFDTDRYEDKVKYLSATSPSMNREVPLAVITPDGTFNESRPTLYLLNGAGGAEQGMDWIVSTANRDLTTGNPIRSDSPAEYQDMVDFYSKQNVNVVIPQAGAFSYYTDWIQSPNRDYLEGEQKWETFLTKELPGALESHINGNGNRAIAGMSMSATSSLLLAQHNPGFYDAVGSFAGCAATAYPIEYEFMRLTVNRGGGEPEQMWGPQGSATNRYNDAMMNAGKLRGAELYISSGSGLAGETDMPSYYTAQGMHPLAALVGTTTLRVEGGVIEGAVNHCTHNLKAKLDAEGIEADYNFRNVGTHSWPGWREDILESWPVFKRAFE
ncbi:alpha/beta hydrolase family protein [Corynebacterium camporealensis]|uniref:alpha/beta hydrolase n=1 Tax=Corynebacterium camporealensis TaxID=161896 RepID=UPI0034CF4930